MLQKSKIKFIVLLMFPVLMLGCDALFEDHGAQFHLDDVNQLEWAPPSLDSGALSATITIPADETESETVSYTVQLIGAHTDEDRTGGVVVSDTDGVEGTQFELLSDEVVIPANSSHGTVELRIYPEHIENGESFSATLELQESPELDVAVNMKDLNLSIEKEESE